MKTILGRSGFSVIKGIGNGSELAQRLKDALGGNPLIGVYVIRARGRKIPRVLKTDREGILDIGKSEDRNGLQQRLRYFVNAAHGKNTSHSAGRRFHQLGYAAEFPLAKIDIYWKRSEDPREEEKDLLIRYESKFLELPPLNRLR